MRDLAPAVLPPFCEERLCALVRERTGIRILDHQLETLRRTILEACQRFGHAGCDTYLDVLKNTPGNAPEHEHLIAGITVGESYFFRDQSQMDYLRRVWLPETIRRRRQAGDLRLRIWSAGCSDGQELYSIIIMLHELIPDIAQWNLHLLGTDINVTALTRAVRGRYSSWSFRATPEITREQYFKPDSGQHWLVSPYLRRLAKFSYLNLREDSFPSILSETSAIDLILCRNVFIYFDPDIVGQVMRKFHASLAPEGHLLLGVSDLLDSATLDGFDLHTLGNTFYLARHERQRHAPETAQPDAPADGGAGEFPTGFSAELPAELSSRRATDSPAARSHPPARAPAQNLYTSLIRLLGCESWHEALAEVEQRRRSGDDSATIWQFRAKILANLGRARDALEACEHSLERDATDKHSHFIRALILAELNRLPAAEESLRRTLYLDRNFVEAHYQIGMLQLRRGQRATGVKSLRNALTIAERELPERRLHDAAGMSHARIAAILRNELNMYDDRPHAHGGKRR